MARKHILCPVDFSSGSDHALRAAVRLATERDAELVLLHAWMLPAMGWGSDFGYAPEVVDQLAGDAQAGLDASVAQAAMLGAAHVTGRLASGVPWQQIVDAAQTDPACELIVIGSHGRTGLGRVLIGSVAETVVRHAPCPVLMIRGEHAAAPFRHVLCPVDFSPWSRAAVELAAQLVGAGGAGLTLLHVLELPAAWGEVRPFDVPRDAEQRATAALDGWIHELGPKIAVPVRSALRVGRAGAQLIAALDGDLTIDLVVMGSHGRTGLERVALGSVAEKTVRHARCSVAVIHRRA